MIRKYQNVFAFYKTTLPVNLALSLCALLLAHFDGFILVFMSLGFVFSLLIKEVNNKTEYLFYYNNKVTKFELWVFSLILNLIIVLLLKFIITLF